MESIPTFDVDIDRPGAMVEALEAQRRQVGAGHAEALRLYSNGTAPAPQRPTKGLALAKIQNSRFPIHGIAARFDRPSIVYGVHETIQRGAFAKAIAEGYFFLQVDHERGPSPRYFANLRAGSLWVEEVAEGLYFVGALDPNVRGAEELYNLIRHKKLNGVSTGSLSERATRFGANAKVVHELEAYEISLCHAHTPGRQGTWVGSL